MADLIVFDIDGVLIDSSSLDDRLPDGPKHDGGTQEIYEDWQQAAIAAGTDLPPMPEAHAHVESILRASPHDNVLLLTSRRHSLLDATREWFAHHMPDLKGYPISMRPEYDKRPGAQSKADRLNAFLAKQGLDPISPVFIVDDDPNVAQYLNPFDKFLHLPDGWTGQWRLHGRIEFEWLWG